MANYVISTKIDPAQMDTTHNPVILICKMVPKLSDKVQLRIELHVCCVYWCMNATGSFKVVWSPKEDSSLTLKESVAFIHQ